MAGSLWERDRYLTDKEQQSLHCREENRGRTRGGSARSHNNIPRPDTKGGGTRKNTNWTWKASGETGSGELEGGGRQETGGAVTPPTTNDATSKKEKEEKFKSPSTDELTEGENTGALSGTHI
jgi:hypothetical protein